MQSRKVLVKEVDVVNITCPICLKTKQLSVARYKEIRKRELRIKCSCDNIFNLCLEYRKHPRKSVELLGCSTNLSKHRECQDIIILVTIIKRPPRKYGQGQTQGNTDEQEIKFSGKRQFF